MNGTPSWYLDLEADEAELDARIREQSAPRASEAQEAELDRIITQAADDRRERRNTAPMRYLEA
jgi:hypothetical protein